MRLAVGAAAGFIPKAPAERSLALTENACAERDVDPGSNESTEKSQEIRPSQAPYRITKF